METRRHGYTLLEVCLVISVVATGAAMFLPAFLSRIELSKYDEAHREMGRIAGAVQAYYEASHTVRGEARTHCLPPSAGPTPAEVGRDAVPTPFGDESVPGHLTWRALRYQPVREVRFRYSVRMRQSRCSVSAPEGTPLVRIEAEADLDGDGELSSFQRGLLVGPEGQLVDGPLLRVRNRVE